MTCGRLTRPLWELRSTKIQTTWEIAARPRINEAGARSLDHCDVMKGRKSQPLHLTLLKIIIAVGASRPLQLIIQITMVAEGGQPPRRPRTIPLTWQPTITRRPPLSTMAAAKVECRRPPLYIMAAANIEYRRPLLYTMAAASFESWQPRLL